MFATYIGVLLQGVKGHLDEYYDKPFDVFESYYEMSGVYRAPSEWGETLGKSTQMDWGSWLYICDLKTVQETIAPNVRFLIPITPAGPGEKRAKIGKSIPFSMLPEGIWYGVLEVEQC